MKINLSNIYSTLNKIEKELKKEKLELLKNELNSVT